MENAFRLDVFFGNMFFYARVPFFLVVAGYLFHHSYARTENMKDTVIKRVKNLMPPYLFWNSVMMLLILVSLKLGLSFDGKTSLSNFDIFKMISGIGSKPANGPLWFIRDLIILFMVSPILLRFRILLPYLSMFTLIFAFNYQEMKFFHISSLGFYSIGIYIYYLIKPKKIEEKLSLLTNRSLYVFLASMLLIAFIKHFEIFPWKIGMIGIFIGISMIIIVGELLARGSGLLSKLSLVVSESSFLIYVANVPIFSMVSKLMDKNLILKDILLQNMIINFLIWLCIGIAVIITIIGTRKFFKERLPRLLILLTGCR
jgi:hypothetical protein